MKTKEFKKKLSLNQETVANLDGDKMDAIRGGLTAINTCHTFCDADQNMSICICQITDDDRTCYC